MVGVARPSHPVTQQSAIFLTDAEATRLAGHPGLVDAIGVLAAPGFDVSRLRAAVGGAQVLTGAARGAAEYPELERTRTALIPVTAAFGGLSMFIAIFVVASTLGLSIQQREREIALLRAVAATPGQIRRMIAWEAAIVALVGSAAGIWPGIVLGRVLAQGLLDHGITPPNYALHYDWLAAAAAIGGGVVTALLAVLVAGRRAARVPPTLALTDAAAEPRLLGPGRVIGGLIALAGAVPLFAVSITTTDPQTAAPTSEINALFLVVAAAFFGPVVVYAVARLLAPALTALSPVGRVPRLREPRRRHPALLLGQHPAGAHRRRELHLFLRLHHHRPRHHPATAGGADGPARHHQRRAGPPGRRAGGRARHARECARRSR